MATSWAEFGLDDSSLHHARGLGVNRRPVPSTTTTMVLTPPTPDPVLELVDAPLAYDEDPEQGLSH